MCLHHLPIKVNKLKVGDKVCKNHTYFDFIVDSIIDNGDNSVVIKDTTQRIHYYNTNDQVNVVNV